MNKVTRYGFIVVGSLMLLGIIGFIVFLNSFEMFEEPTRDIVRSECDYEGLRQATVFTLAGNATANPSLHVSAKLGCNGNTDEAVGNLLFTADTPFLNGDEVEVKWVSFDTLRITYDARLRVFKEAQSISFEDSTLNFVIDYHKKK
jgi:hypothetical protein